MLNDQCNRARGRLKIALGRRFNLKRQQVVLSEDSRMKDEKTYSLRQIERKHGIDRRTLREAIDQGLLRATRSSDGGWIVSKKDLITYLRGREHVAGERQSGVAPQSPLVAELAAEEHRLAERLDKLTEGVRAADAKIARLRRRNAVLKQRDKAARAVMLEVRELMEIQGQRIDDLKSDKVRLEEDKAQMVALLKQAHDRLLDVDGERKQLFDRLLAIIDVKDGGVAQTGA
jgi:predicted site-specific integrase-resolvase